MRKNLTAITVLVSLLALVSISAISEGSASSPKLYVDPPKVVGSALAPGLSFSVNVTVVDVVDLSTYEFNMSYNKDVLACQSVSVGPEENLPTPNWAVNNGTIWIKTIYDTPITSGAPVTVATLRFKIQGRGISFLNFTYTSLSNSLGEPIFHEAAGGYFQNFLLGDVNDDGVVNIADILIAAYALGSSSEGPNIVGTPYDPRADLTGDGRVNIGDIVVIALNFGATYP